MPLGTRRYSDLKEHHVRVIIPSHILQDVTNRIGIGAIRDYLVLHVNSKRLEIRGQHVFSSLTDFLREELHLVGTKVVCAEGDCGACTVLVGRLDKDGLRYETVDACIQFLYQLDCKHIVTIEGLQASPNQLHPVQDAMVKCHGSQCGYCTPGMVMALAGLCEQNDALDEAARTRVGLTGNLCRCTGYLPILDAARSLPSPLSSMAQKACGGKGQEERIADLPERRALQSG